MRTLVAAFALLVTNSCLAATLHARDLNSDGVADAYFDSVLNISWLADADYAHTSGYAFTPSSAFEGYHHITGEWMGMSLPTALTWVGTLDIHGVTGWRLPSIRQTCEPADPNIPYLLCSHDGELMSLFSRLAGSAGPFTNLPPATTPEAAFYQYGNSVLCTLPIHSIYCMAAERPFGGLLLTSEYAYGMASWAVRDGDVSPVPEPTTTGLLLAGLAAIYRRRQTYAPKLVVPVRVVPMWSAA